MLNEIAVSNKRTLIILTAFLFVMTVVGCNSNMHKSSKLDSIVEGNQLAKLINEKPAEKIILLDVRSEDEYNKGHLAGAILIDLKDWEEESLASETDLEHETLWKNKIGKMGINGYDPVIIYDDGRMTNSARIWFILQHFGVLKTSVVNGGYPMLESQIRNGNLTISYEQTKPVPVIFEPNGKTSASVKLIERQNVLESIEEEKSQILDTRTHDEYKGIDLRNNPRGGHLPAAINLPHKELLDDKGRLKSPEKLAKIFKKAGFKKGSPIIIYCNSGGRASLTALAAKRAGYGPVMNYYHSFKEWSAEMSCPLEMP